MKRERYVLPYNILSALMALVLCIGCGEDRTYEYEEWTGKNQSMQSLMSEWYLWGDSLKDLEWKTYFGNESDFFTKLTAQAPVTDKWSYCAIDTIERDYHERGLFNHLDSYGLDLSIIDDPTRLTNQSYARIITIYPGSPAEECGLKRGEFIGYFDGTKVTANNISQLKSGTAKTLVVNTLDFIGDSAIWKSVDTLALAASRQVKDVQVMVAERIRLEDATAAYVMLSNLNEDDFVGYIENTKGADILILDLRLCNDGTLENACKLASFIAGEEASSKVFCQTIWNKGKQSLNQTYKYGDYATIGYTDAKDIYIITGTYTQGAAEWLIKGLKATINEKFAVVGATTAGQNVMLKAIPSEYKYTLYPAVAYVADADGNYDYNGGIEPDMAIDEYLYHPLRDYGDVNEMVLNYILNVYE